MVTWVTKGADNTDGIEISIVWFNFDRIWEWNLRKYYRSFLYIGFELLKKLTNLFQIYWFLLLFNKVRFLWLLSPSKSFSIYKSSCFPETQIFSFICQRSKIFVSEWTCRNFGIFLLSLFSYPTNFGNRSFCRYK